MTLIIIRSSSPLRFLRSVHDLKCELRHSVNQAESQMHLLIIIRSLVCATSVSFPVRNTLDIIFAHSLCTSVRNVRACVKSPNFEFFRGYVWYNIIVIEMLPNRHTCLLSFELPLHIDAFDISATDKRENSKNKT